MKDDFTVNFSTSGAITSGAKLSKFQNSAHILE